MNKQMQVLILGASGMLGHTLLFQLQRHGFDVYGTMRNVSPILPADLRERIRGGVDVNDFSSIIKVMETVKPDVLINCVGIIRQLPEGKMPLPCIDLNARFPHLLIEECRKRGVRLIHYGTDCVFDGHKGSPYTEDDPCTASDIYGITKYLGELKDEPALTIRTSIIGPELRGRLSLVEWFLAQEGSVKGYTHALYTGLPTSEHARILIEFVFPRPALCGLYQVASSPISKYDLLKLIAEVYGKSIRIVPDTDVVDDKRLDGTKFHLATGYTAPAWPELVTLMHESHIAFEKELK